MPITEIPKDLVDQLPLETLPNPEHSDTDSLSFRYAPPLDHSEIFDTTGHLSKEPTPRSLTAELRLHRTTYGSIQWTPQGLTYRTEGHPRPRYLHTSNWPDAVRTRVLRETRNLPPPRRLYEIRRHSVQLHTPGHDIEVLLYALPHLHRIHGWALGGIS